MYLWRMRSQQERLRQQQQLFTIEKKQLEQQLNQCDDQLDKLHLQLQQTQDTANTLQQEKLELYAEVRELSATKAQLIEAHQQQLDLINTNHDAVKNQFSHLAQQTLEQKSDLFAKQNQANIDSIIAPLKAQLGDFKQQVQHSHDSETKQRHQLQHEIHSLKQLNQQMTQDAINLTRALKGDNKQQGNWGELILERVLQESGLRQGHEYHTQSQHKNEQGKTFRPDVIVHLPDAKDIVIDSKVSLTSYERYFNSESEQQQQLALREHIASIRQHIKDLSNKDYHQLQGIRSLDYVLLFIPIEPAFLLAIEHQPDLISEAMNHNIMLVSPTNLLVALRTIHNLWRYDQQNKNAQLIADKASKLYDKLRLFSDDLLNVGHCINRANQSYEQAFKKLSQGKGNLVSQVEAFRELGVTVKKPLSQQLTDSTDSPLAVPLNQQE
ncbi:DNA recombination protein RmuC [Psychrobium sp. 1_MG-2023]|uniref:DNA recombination protein RmuC n=1 Tax=Psychrobium sp. 1_MG-2023 TaxID=3062624 RepID=UPI002737790D|nr:DNA recombination protein RmuC [Psychrobium sp. 1_MG-2023]MDP2560834.1 DNA recombination protein RmuC [Psychrobium sp. 1_MG-2023]